jgi:hypothetical protein
MRGGSKFTGYIPPGGQPSVPSIGGLGPDAVIADGPGIGWLRAHFFDPNASGSAWRSSFRNCAYSARPRFSLL